MEWVQMKAERVVRNFQDEFATSMADLSKEVYEIAKSKINENLLSIYIWTYTQCTSKNIQTLAYF